MARDSGDVSSLFPEGITSMRDMPWTLHRAIGMGLSFLRMEELPEDEQPPRNIWFDPDRMDEHWAAVRQRREEKYGDKSRGIDDGGPTRKNAFLDDYYVK